MHKILVFSFLQVLLILSIGCKTKYAVVKSQFASLKVQADNDTTFPSMTERFLKPYRQQLQDSFSTVLATATGDFIKKRPGGSLGNLVVEAMKYFTPIKLNSVNNTINTRFYLMNYGGIRLNEISKGALTIGKIYELLPFENTVVRIQISGEQLANLLVEINKEGGWPCLYVKAENKSGRLPAEEYILADIRKLRNIELYTNNYLAAGGDNCSILKTLPQEDTGILLRDAVIYYLKEQKTITPDNTDYILK